MGDMVRVRGFFRDRRGLAAVDYGFTAVLLFTTLHLSQSYGDLIGSSLHRAYG